MSREDSSKTNHGPANNKRRDVIGQVLLKRPLMVVGLVLCFCIVVIVGHVYRLQANLVEAQSLHNAQLLSQAVAEFRSLYTSEVVQRLDGDHVVVTHNYLDVEGAVPLPATLSIILGNRIGAVTDGTNIRLYSPFPFPWREEKGGLRDLFGEEAWEALSKNPEVPFYRFDTFNGRPVVRYATADIMRPACVGCHNSHPDTPKADWAVGDLRGVLEVIAPVDRAFSITRTGVLETFFLMLVVTVVLLMILVFVLSRWREAMGEVKSLARRTMDANHRLQAEIGARQRAEASLEQRAEELARSNKDLEQFAYVASHDLQEPLRKIRAFGSRLEKAVEEVLSEDARDYLNRMLDASGRMQQLINDLLTFSRVTSAALPMESVDLNRLLESVLRELDGMIEDSGAAIHVGDLPIIEANPTQLRQLFQNLLSNGIKFAREGVPPEISISAKLLDAAEAEEGEATSRDRPGRLCRITVTDNGIGFEKKFESKIFEMFKRLHARGTYPGTGIGLAVCQRIVDRHGGSIRAYSEAGAGATFVITLPVEQSNKGEHSS